MVDKPPSPFTQLRRALARALDPRSAETPPPSPEEKPQSLSANVIGTVMEFDRAFAIERNRTQRLDDYEEMDQGDVAAQLDALVDASTVSEDGQQRGFEVRIQKVAGSSGAKYATIVGQMLIDTQLNEKVRQYLRNTAKRADTFLEIVFDEAQNVRRVKSVPPRYMRIKVDEHGDLEVGVAEVPSLDGGFVRVASPYLQIDPTFGDVSRVVASWFPWEMLHIKWEEDDEHIYSRSSFLEPIRRDWRRLKAIEDGLAVARIERAYLRRIHHVDNTGKTDEKAEENIESVKRKLTERTTSDKRAALWPPQVSTDLYLGRQHRVRGDRLYDDLNKVEIIDPHNTGLENIGDVEYFRTKLFTRVPADLVGAGKFKGTDLTTQDVAFGKMVLYAQWLMTHRLIVPLCMIAVRLKGFNPQPSDFVVEWPTAVIRGSWRWADARFRESMMHVNHAEWGIISRERIAKAVYQLSDEDWEAEKERVRAEQEELPTPGQQSVAQQQRLGNQSS